MKLLELSSHLEENYDIILIDVGAGAHNSVRNFLLAADQALIVLTPEPTAIMDAYSLIKVMADHQYNSKLGLLINQVQSKKEAIKVFERMSEVIKKYLEVDVQNMGYIPFDSNITRSVKKQKPFVKLFPETDASNYIKDLAHKMLDKKKQDTSRGVKGFMYRIIGMFNRSH
ncbi:MAG: P-loop NTPase [Bacillota bacterium]